MNTSLITPTPRQVGVDLLASALGGDVEAVGRLVTDDFVLHVPGSHPLAGDHRGAHGLVAFVRETRGRTDDGEHVEVLDVLEGERHAAVYCRVTATRDGRRPLDNLTVHLVRVQGDRAAEAWLHNWDHTAVDEFWS